MQARPAIDETTLRGSLAREWYHTLELAPGIVTPGWFDTRKIVSELPFPSLEGKRCLDVATFDGFWAFEMERRGAAETVGIDILDPLAWDWPPDAGSDVVDAMERRKEGGKGFEIARAALGSDVRRVELSVYDLDPAEVGTFDFVYVGSLLMHLRDPIRALERVRSVCSGQLLVVDNFNLGLWAAGRNRPLAELEGRGRPWWWRVNLAGLVRMVEAAGFDLMRYPKRIWMPPGPGHPRARPTRQLLRSHDARHLAMSAVKGDPHAIILAAPREPASPQAALAVGRRLRGHGLQAVKKRVIDAVFERAPTSSFADLGGVWAVDGGYSFYALDAHNPARGVVVDEEPTERVRSRAEAHPRLELVEANFGSPAARDAVGSVDCVLLFDVLLHQVEPDWDGILEMYAPATRDFAIVNPQYVGSDQTTRLVDLGRERYMELVPPQDNLAELWERIDEFDEQRGRHVRDFHNFWQWGITDDDLRARMDALGFDLVFYENAGSWRGLEAFENHAFVFTRRAP